MDNELCRLCFQHPPIKNSHVIPAFVFRRIKEDSPTGFFRNPNNPNQRLQDGDKLSLLCPNCEQRFSEAEAEFASNIFFPFHERDQDEFAYGPWLHYFMTSLAWRTLTLDLPGLESDVQNPRPMIDNFLVAADTMQKYLLGANNLAGSISNHAVVWTKGDSGSAELAAFGPNVKIRRSAFGFTTLDREHGYCGILHNIAGFMCFLIVNGNPRDTWKGTNVDSSGGTITQPQNVDSWLIWELLSTIVDAADGFGEMSETQREIVEAAVGKNPSAPAMRFRRWDERLGEEKGA